MICDANEKIYYPKEEYPADKLIRKDKKSSNMSSIYSFQILACTIVHYGIVVSKWVLIDKFTSDITYE